jgi:hypothetical protein
MYHQISVNELSPRQISRLLNGHPVSIKPHPQGKHAINASLEQVNKMSRAYKKGSGMRIMLDPYQQQFHRGTGFFSNMISKALPMVKNVLKETLLPKAQDFLMNKAQTLIPGLINKGVDKLSASKFGHYIPDSVYDMAKDKGSEFALQGVDFGLNKASDFAKSKIGSGVRRKKLTQKELMIVEHLKHKKGKGFLNDLLGNIPFVGSVLKDLDNSIGGRGIKHNLTKKEIMLIQQLKNQKGAGFLNDLLGNIPFVGNMLKDLDNSIGGHGLQKARRRRGSGKVSLSHALRGEAFQGRALMPAGY